MKPKTHFLRVAPAVLMGLTMTACGAASSPTASSTNGAQFSGTFIFSGFGGSNEDTLVQVCLDPFAKLHHIKAEAVTNSGLAELELMEKTHKVTWDVTYSSVYSPGAGNWSSLLTPINYSIVNKNILPSQYRSYATKYGMAHDVGADAIVYNKDKIHGSQIPKTWADFYNVKSFPGTRAIGSVDYAGPYYSMQALNTALTGSTNPYPLNFSAAVALLHNDASDMVFYNSSTQAEQLLTSGRVDIADVPTASVVTALLAQKFPLGVNWNQNVVSPEFLEVPKGAPDVPLAMEFIQYCDSTQQQIAYAKLHPNGPVNAAAIAALSPAVAATLPTHYSNIASPIDSNWWTPARVTAATNQLLTVESQ